MQSDGGGIGEQIKTDRQLLIRVLIEWSGRSRGQVKELLVGRSEDELMNFRNNKKIKVIIGQIESESPI